MLSLLVSTLSLRPSKDFPYFTFLLTAICFKSFCQTCKTYQICFNPLIPQIISQFVKNTNFLLILYFIIYYIFTLGLFINYVTHLGGSLLELRQGKGLRAYGITGEMGGGHNFSKMVLRNVWAALSSIPIFKEHFERHYFEMNLFLTTLTPKLWMEAVKNDNMQIVLSSTHSFIPKSPLPLVTGQCT